jgi:hypothetical protein
MSRGIFLIQGDGSLVEMTEQPYDTEALLQGLIERYPDLLAGDQIDPQSPRKWLLVSREVALASEEGGGGRWSVDHLFLDQDSVPTIVEVKRSTDTRIRREVVGQMLDYAANAVVYWPMEALRAQFEASCERRGVDPESELAALLGPEADAAAFWLKAKTNLQAGRVRLVFLADEIPPELRRIVEFLNQQMDPAEVLAVEVRQFVGQGLKTLVPSVLGQTAEAQRRKSGTTAERKQWDEESFFREQVHRNGSEVARVAREFFDWAVPRTTRIWWGRGGQNGSFVPVLHHNGTDHQIFAVYTSGSIELYFQWYRTKPPFGDEHARRELLDRFNQVPGVSIPDNRIDGRPNIPLRDFVDRERRAKFVGVLEWYLQQVKQ